MSQITSSIVGIIPGGPVETLTSNSGGAVGPTAGNINVVGDGVTLTGVGNPGTSTITFSVLTMGFTWNVSTVSPVTLVKENGYFTNNAGGITYNLPAVSAVGDTVIVADQSGAWTIQCGVGQSIIYGSTETSVGGNLVSGNIGDSVTLVCYAANTTWFAINGAGGTITVT